MDAKVVMNRPVGNVGYEASSPCCKTSTVQPTDVTSTVYMSKQESLQVKSTHSPSVALEGLRRTRNSMTCVSSL